MIGNDGLHGALTQSITIALTAGSHAIEVRYFEATGDQHLQLEWEGPGTPRQIVPEGAVTHGEPAPDPDPVPVNTAPAPQDDAATAIAGEEITLDVLANDADPDGDALTITDAGTATHGAVSIVGGQLKYTANPDFEGTETLTYTVSDGELTSTATVTIGVTAPEPEPELEPVLATGRGQFLDARDGDGTAVADLGGEGARIVAVNRYSLLGEELGVDAQPAYTVTEHGATAEFDGVTVRSSYWSLESNLDKRNGDALSDTALESALEFGAVVTNATAITGTEYDDQMLGRRMDDHFIGGGGSDRLRGADGNDILEGGDGHDRLEGGRGDDILEGGADMDRFLYYAGHGTDTILDATAEDRIEIYDIDTGNVLDALENATEVGGNMVIDFGNGDSLILAGVSDAEMDLLDFRF